MKKLGFGLMRLPLTEKGNDAAIDLEQSKKMVDMFIERGFTYFDTAWMYHRHESEKAVKELLINRHPRESFTLATKLHAEFFDSAEGMEEVFETQRQKTGAEYFDYYLIHDIEASYYEKFTKYGAFEWLKNKKEQGLVRQMGFSFHDTPELLDRVLFEHPEMDFVQLQINYLDWESEKIRSRECYETARRHGKSIIVMEPVKGGVLSVLPGTAQRLLYAAHPDWSPAQWAVKFAAGLDGVMMVLSGMSSIGQVDDNTAYMNDFKPLDESEIELLTECARIIRSDVRIDCTGCSYCTDGCPMQIPIPRYFSLYNAEFKDAGHRSWVSQKDNYKQLSAEKSKASDCIGCGQCELICPQHLKVTAHLKEVAECFE